MTEEKQFGGLDRFKMAAAFLVVAIHTSPFASFGADGDFIITRVLARVAVPFFFMVTGYFLLPQYLFGRSMDDRPFWHVVKKLLALYTAAILLYLPVNVYAGQLKGIGTGDFLRMVLVDGTFYHLWYLPAAVLGIVTVWLLGRKLPFKVLLGLSFILYLFGLFGDSYYGLAEQIPFWKGIYDAVFLFSSHTRNGLFYAPVFLVMGAGFFQAGHGKQSGDTGSGSIKRTVFIWGLVTSLGLMCAEGVMLHRRNLQRHDSMYLLLPPVMFFLFRLLLSVRKTAAKDLREISTWIYIIHPLCIILVRGGAKMVRLENLLVENSLLHYIAVCAASFAAAAIGRRIFSYVSVTGRENKDFREGRAWIELSREDLFRNVKTLQSLLAPGQRLMPAVKADAYGHGAALIAKELQNMGIENFCTACVAEGVELRKNGITGEILVLGYTHPKEFALLRRYRLSQTVVDYAYGKVLNSYGKKLKVHLKIDTGMHRLGERAEKIKEIGRIFRLKNLQVEGIYTHLCADETRNAADQAYTKAQGTLFYEVLENLERRGSSGLRTHLLASYGLLNYPELGGDHVRVGIALYGLLSDERAEDRCRMNLRPVLAVKARIAIVKELHQGEYAGYGPDYMAEKERKIAVLSIGYADGLPRSLSCGNGRVLIHGQSAPIIGRICMDQTIVDVTGISDVKAGEIATVIGKAGDMEITAYEVAKKAGTITNEILSRLGGRLKRGMN